jgi:hypothetical protein
MRLVLERVWLERVCLLIGVVNVDDCIFVEQMRVAGKTGAARHVRIHDVTIIRKLRLGLVRGGK